MRRAISRACVLAAIAAVVVGLPRAASAAVGTIRVTSLADNDVADGNCTLREAIISANNGSSYHGCSHSGNADNNIDITLPGSISLTSSLPVSSNRPRTIRGKGAMLTEVVGNGFGGIKVTSSTLNVVDLKFSNFSTSTIAVSAGASASIDHVLIYSSGDPSFTSGGCIANSGSLGVYFSQLELCHGFSGGAIRTELNSFTVVQNSSVLKSESEHGVIYNRGSFSFVQSTMGSNRAGVSSAGIFNDGGSVTIDASTLAYSKHTLTGGANVLYNFSGTMHVKGSVVFGDPTATGSDCIGTIVSDGNNAYRPNVGCVFGSSGDRAVNDPKLQPFAGPEDGFTNLPRQAGGLARVYLPASDSALVGQISGSTSDGDQRGVRRKATGSDIGAVQRGTALLVVANLSLTSGDQLIKSVLTNDGFAVTTVTDVAAVSADANNRTVVVISESVTSGNVNTKFRNTSTGVVVNEPFLFDDMNMTGSAADQFGTSNETTINVERGTIGKGAGYLGLQTVILSPNISFGHGIPTSFVQPTFQAWRSGFPSQAMLFFYPKSMTMANGFVAPGIRVGTCFTEAATSTANLVSIRLLEESILAGAGPTF